jgi:uncharacterized damage-inducible protein DinB
MTSPAAPTRFIVMLQALNHAPARAAELTASLSDEAHHWQPGLEEWTMQQLVAHLAAAEAPFLKRLARIVEEDHPWLAYFGPDVARPDSTEALPTLLSRFRAARDELLRFLSSLPPEAWERPATHETMGPTTLALQVQNIISHDADHLEQLYDLRRAWENQAQRRL